MIWIRRQYWLWVTMPIWVFKHSFHGSNHKVNGSAIDKQFDDYFFRCRRCQERLSIPM